MHPYKQQLNWLKEDVDFMYLLLCRSVESTGKDTMQSSAHDSDMLNPPQPNHLHVHALVNLNQVNSPKLIHLMSWLT